MYPNQYYFISDVHLGIPNRIHKNKLLNFFKRLKAQTTDQQSKIHLFILGDLFEFWAVLALTTHKKIIENNIILKELRQLKAVGIKIYFLPGNHDYHLKETFQQKFEFTVLDKFNPISLNNKQVYLGHGEEINSSGFSSMTLKIYRSQIPLLLFSLIGLELAFIFSKILSNFSSRLRFQTGLDNKFLKFAQKKISQENYDIVILSHTHKPRLEKIGQGYYLNTGDWINNFSYGILNQNKLSLERFS
ncbi:MAG: UDP-2,3-diacylglucosamine diphosphatase [candidate division WOR-3 bacterium]|nr:UDP-2,3-diacylglucosamine diphosphatase [candidate division WOR-3 bacterium]